MIESESIQESFFTDLSDFVFAGHMVCQGTQSPASHWDSRREVEEHMEEPEVHALSTEAQFLPGHG